MTRLHHTLLLSVVLALAASAASPTAQSPIAGTGVLAGRVVLQGDTGAANGEVLIKRIGPDAERRAQVTTGGAFRFESLPAGEYQLLATAQGRFETVNERVIVAPNATTTLEPIEVLPGVTCECSYEIQDRSRGQVLLHFGDANGHRLLRSYLQLHATSQGGDEDRLIELGPSLVCICGRDVEKMGRELLIQLKPGVYSLWAAASGYARWKREAIVVRRGEAIDINVPWEPADDGATLNEATASLRPGEVLVRLETMIKTQFLAVAADAAPGTEFLRAVDKHAFDGAVISGASFEMRGLAFGFSLERQYRSGADPVRLIHGAGAARTIIGRLITRAGLGMIDLDLSVPRWQFGPVPVLSVARVR